MVTEIQPMNYPASMILFTKKDYRGKEKEVAKFLLNILISWCNQKVIQEIYLGTRAIFLAAHRFYEKNGFDEISKDILPISFPLMQTDSKFYTWRAMKKSDISVDSITWISFSI